MNLRKSIALWLLKAANAAGITVSKWQSGRLYYPDVSYYSLVQKYQGWVYTCANKNAISCAQIPLRLYAAKPSKKTKALFPTRKVSNERLKYLSTSPSTHRFVTKATEVEEVLEHPFLELIANVNEFMNGFDLFEGTYLADELTGNAYWYIANGNMGLPTAIWPLFPQYMKIVPDKQNFISHYEYKIVGNEKQDFKPEEMIHFKYPNPRDAFYGLGPLQACVVAADLSFSMNTYETTLMENRGQPDMALVIPPEAGDMSDENKKAAYAAWDKRFKGAKKAGKLTILTGGADLKPLTLTPREMNFLQGRKWTLTEIAAVFGVPMSKVTTEDVNRANAEAGDYSYMKDTVLPRLRRVEQKLNEQLLPKYDARLFCAYDNPVPEDKEFRLKQAESRLKTGQTTINEERQIDGQDEVEYGSVPIMPMTMVPIGSAPSPVLPPKAVKKKAPRTLPPLGHPTNFVSEPFVKDVQAFFNEQEREILANFEQDADAFKIATKDRAGDFVSSWFNLDKWNKRLGEVIEPHITTTFVNGGERALRRVVAEAEFDSLNPAAQRALEQHRLGSVVQVNANTIKSLRFALAQGIAEGEGITDLRKRLQNAFAISPHRSVVIARTETIWAWNEGAVQGYKQSGVVTKKQWISSGDPRSCDFCLDMDGKIIDVDVDYFGKGDSYTVGERSLDFSYESVGHPPIHPMCRCTIIPIIEEF